MKITKKLLSQIIDAYMSEMFAESQIIKCDDPELMEKHFDIIDKYWRDNEEKLIIKVVQYLKDVDNIIVEE